MISCKVDISSLLPKNFKCGNCNLCREKDKNTVNKFDDDLKTASVFEEELKQYVLDNLPLEFEALKVVKNPDLTFTFKGHLICRVEAKFLKGFAPLYMENKIGLSGKETLVIDEPKLKHYIERSEKDGDEIPTFIVWFFGRPCEDFKDIVVYQSLDKLKAIYEDETNKNRLFERKPVDSDYVNRKLLGILKKFHFSVKEMKPIFYLIPEIAEVLRPYQQAYRIIEKIENIQRLEQIKDNKIDVKNVLYFLSKKTFEEVDVLVNEAYYKSKESNKLPYFIGKYIFDEKRI